MTQTTRIATLAALAALAIPSSAIVRLHTVEDREYLNFGANFAAVGLLDGLTGNGSGTLVAPDWVLTAAHVIMDDGGRPTDFKFVLNGKEFGVDRVVYNEDRPWNRERRMGRDIALVKLKAKVADTAPARLYEGAWTNAALFAAETAFAGFGLIGDGRTGAVAGSSDGRRRAATNEIDGIRLVNPDTNEVSLDGSVIIDFDSPDGQNNTLAGLDRLGGRDSNATPTRLEGLPVAGDSGGGLFIRVGDEWRLAGVGEAGGRNTGYGGLAVFTTIRDHRDWIVNTVPEPGTMAAVGLGLAALARRRRAK